MRGLVARSAWTTAAYLVGGLVLGIGLALLLSPFPERIPALEVLSGALALVVLSAASGAWGRAIGRLAGAGDLRRMTWAGALGVGPVVLLVGIALGMLEGVVVEGTPGGGRPPHVAFTLLFVPATLLVAAVGALALGIGLRSAALGGKLALGAGLSAALAFLAVDLTMDALGWRVGAPGAAERATMLTVTALGSLAAALAAGASIGLLLGRRAEPTAGR